MHVSRALLVLLVALAGCHAKDERRRAAPVLVHPTAPSAEPVDKQFLAVARTVRDAATKLALTCRLFGREADPGFERYSDHCMFDPRDTVALAAAAAELSKQPPGTSGTAALFREEARLFAAWVELTKNEDGATGTLSHYQSLASAWNGLVPEDRIPIDVQADDRYTKRTLVTGDGGALVWSRCSTGPCVIVPGRGR
jgi:hypothetical protein